MLMKLPSRKTKIEFVIFGSIPDHWDKAKCKAQFDSLNEELHELTGKAERFAEANGYYCDSLNDQADQITNWMLDLEEAMETR